MMARAMPIPQIMQEVSFILARPARSDGDGYASCAETYATLRILSNGLDPDVISSELGLEGRPRGDRHAKVSDERPRWWSINQPWPTRPRSPPADAQKPRRQQRQQ